MKKYILSITAMALGILSAYSQTVSVEDVTIKAGETEVVSINLNNSQTNIVSFQMDLTLPEGITINKAGCSLGSRITDADQGLTIGKQPDGSIRLTSTSFALTPISGTSGEIVQLSLTAANDAKGGTASLKNIILATSDSEKYTPINVSFIVNVPYTLTYLVDGEVYKTSSVVYGTTITPEVEPTKEGYTFSGWSEIPATMPNHDVEVSGTFSINSYSLSYLVDGEVYKTLTVDYGTTIIPEAEPIKEGYTFSGWSEIPKTMPAHDVEVTGTFSVNSYFLTYLVDGEVYKTLTVLYGTALTPEAEPVKDGYTFNGWSEIPATMPAHDVEVTGTFNYTLTFLIDGEVFKTFIVPYGTEITPEAEPTKEGHTFSGWSEIPETMPAHDVEVTGSFSINSYTLIYKLDGKDYMTFSVEYGTALTPLTAPVRKGMTFMGWGDVPETMPAYDVTLSGSYSWSKETFDGVTYQVSDTLNNYASVIGIGDTNGEVTILPTVLIGGDVYAVNSVAYNVLPRTVTVYTSVSRFLFWLWANGYEDIKEMESGRALSAPEPTLVATNASSLRLSYTNEYPELSETVMALGAPVIKGENGYEIVLTGLNPDNLYEGIVSLTLTFEDASYTKSYSYRTKPLTLATQQSRVISAGNVIVSAKSNLDDEETNIGFEWRRIDWPDDFASNSGTAYLYEGTMEGYIRNLYTGAFWRYRPYYESNAGNRYYGEWVGIDPTNTGYYEPTVHTYAQINVSGNRAEVKGYAMRGTDRITSQGFMYWPSNTSVSLRKKAASVPTGATIVEATGNVMTAVFEDLDYEAEYCYVAFVKTEENETFYGEVLKFSTNADPDGIRDIEQSPLNIEHSVEAWYDLSGCKLAAPQKGINIIRMSDGTTRKLLVK